MEETVDATPRTSDGQLLFLMEMISKMKTLDDNPQGARTASVHDGSSLFTGDAGGGESNIRRYIIENDMLDCIIQLPNNMFYSTGITTYIWIVTNNKEKKRQGKVLLIDASKQFVKLRKNLGNKNCELHSENIQRIRDAYMNFETIERADEDSLTAKVFNNNEFGYYKVTIQRPKRLKARLTQSKIEELRYEKDIEKPMEWAYYIYGDHIYENLSSYERNILDWCEEK